MLTWIGLVYKAFGRESVYNLESFERLYLCMFAGVLTEPTDDGLSGINLRICSVPNWKPNKLTGICVY